MVPIPYSPLRPDKSILDVEQFDDPRVKCKFPGVREFRCSIRYHHFRETETVKDGSNLSIIVVGNR